GRGGVADARLEAVAGPWSDRAPAPTGIARPHALNESNGVRTPANTITSCGHRLIHSNRCVSTRDSSPVDAERADTMPEGGEDAQRADEQGRSPSCSGFSEHRLLRDEWQTCYLRRDAASGRSGNRPTDLPASCGRACFGWSAQQCDR